ncbi:MAG: cupin domain-containing protein [Desulfobacterales bacterium]|nr:cupin domain-containing protein [Desulfobacterales bacterium]
MFTPGSREGYQDVIDKIRMKTTVYGAHTLMAEFRLQAGAELPLHRHPHEQTGYLVAGRMELTIGAQTHAVRPGDSWCIPGEVEHGAIVLEDSIAVEVFTPVREDYLPAGD